MEDTEMTALQKKLDELSATVNRQHAEHFGWLNQMLQQQNNMLSSQVGSLRQEQQSLKRALGITDANMPFEPYYNRSVEMSSREPELYNKYGERMQPIFLSDRNGAHDPYAFMPRYIFFDRYDYALKNHMYTGDEAFRTVGKPINKFAQPGENRAIHPHIYEHYLQNRSYFENEVQYVFTHDDEILNTFSNARLILSYAGLYWYGNQQPKMGNNKIDEHRGGGEILSAENYKNKTKNISIIASNKRMCRMHLVRQEFAKKCKAEHLADTFGRFDGGPYVPIEVPFQHYRFSIAIENFQSRYYFTEKITNCFAAQTIPIYLGATEIDKFYNPDGIITLKESDFDHLGDFLKQCTPEEYERRLPAVIDNYNRLFRYADANYGMDLLYKQYIRPVIEAQ